MERASESSRGDPIVPTVHDEIAQGLRDHPAKKGMAFNALVTLIEIGGSIGLFHLAKGLRSVRDFARKEWPFGQSG